MHNRRRTDRSADSSPVFTRRIGRFLVAATLPLFFSSGCQNGEAPPANAVAGSTPGSPPQVALSNAAPDSTDNGAVPADSGDAVVHLTIENVESNKGALRVAIFQESSSFPDHERAMRKMHFPVEQTAEPVTLDPLPAGRYALAVYHDVNDDASMNKSAFGVPTEPYGFSNNARGKFGPPNFGQAVIELTSGEQAISVRIQ